MIAWLRARARAKASMGILPVLAASFLVGCAMDRTPGSGVSTSLAAPVKARSVSGKVPASQPAVTRTVAATPACSGGCGAKPAIAADTDPMKILQDTLIRCEALEGYEIVFHRQERRGLMQKLSDWENLKVYYRRRPNAIKMTWLNEDSEYREIIFVEGVDDGKVTVMPRKGLLGLPPMAIKVPPDEAVKWGKSLRPITDFGLAAMVRRTLGQLEKAREAGGAKVTYQGQTTVDRLGTRAHHVTIVYPAGLSRTAKQDLYIDIETGYPCGAYLWLANGDLSAAYLYEKPTIVVPAEEVFAISSGKGLAKKS